MLCAKLPSCFTLEATGALTITSHVGDCLPRFANDVSQFVFAKDVSALLGRGGLRLKKWTSSLPKMSVTFVGRDSDNTVALPPLSRARVRRQLGASCETISGEPNSLSEPAGRSTTRRSFLFTLPSLFDLTGLVNPMCFLE